MRLFIAIEVPEELYGYFLELQNELNLDSSKLALTKSFHLTLKFLGEVDEDKKDKISALLNQIQLKQFSVELNDIGVFPNENYIKVVWVGLESKNKVVELQQNIDNALSNLFQRDKRFHSHITLARVRFIKDKKEFIKSLKKIKVDKKSFEVKDFKLIKSTLTPQGPVYEVLEEFSSN